VYCFVSIVLFCVLCVCVCVCKCVLYCCHRVSTQLQLNIYHIISYACCSMYSLELLLSVHQQADSSICLTYACCCMYSLELLMMDGKTVRNMFFFK